MPKNVLEDASARLDVEVLIPAAMADSIDEDNAGDVTVSDFEWMQNRDGERWDEDTVHDKLEGRILRTTHEIFDVMDERGLPRHVAAYALALERLEEAVEASTGR